MKNKLKIVGVSIGNLEDLTIRAIKTIFDSDYILAEDTRVYLKLKNLLIQRFESLLNTLELKVKQQKLISYRDQNHDRVIEEITQLVKDEEKVALVSDAGMPGISDPGFKLIRDLYLADLEVEIIPGATSVSTALLLSGLPTDRYSFLGFIPRKAGKAKTVLKQFENTDSTLIIFESPFRVIKTLEIIAEVFEEAEVAATTELTKMHETVFKGNAKEVITQLSKFAKLRGEWVLCVRV